MCVCGCVFRQGANEFTGTSLPRAVPISYYHISAGWEVPGLLYEICGPSRGWAGPEMLLPGPQSQDHTPYPPPLPPQHLFALVVSAITGNFHRLSGGGDRWPEPHGGEQVLFPTSQCPLHSSGVPDGNEGAADSGAAELVVPGGTAKEGASGGLTASWSSEAGFLLPQPH